MSKNEVEQSDGDSDEFQYLTEAKVTEMVPLRALLACKLRREIKSSASRQIEAEPIPEVFIIGEILSCDGFLSTQSGIFCNWHFQWYDPWVLLEVLIVLSSPISYIL